jgi:hypothetical protein
MASFPYFLQLLHQDELLCSIITTGSFAHINLTSFDHRFYSDQVFDLFNYSLENEFFTKVNIILVDGDIGLVFHTTSVKYLEEPKRYFQRQAPERTSAPYIIFGQEARTRKKNLGQFPFLGPLIPPASVSLRQSSLYGYVISIDFYQHNLLNASDSTEAT